jgi:hypothetical protein
MQCSGNVIRPVMKSLKSQLSALVIVKSMSRF